MLRRPRNGAATCTVGGPAAARARRATRALLQAEGLLLGNGTARVHSTASQTRAATHEPEAHASKQLARSASKRTALA